MKSTSKTLKRETEHSKEKHLVAHFDREQIISERAYEIWQRRGCAHGYDQDDWLAAEKELVSEELLMAYKD